MFSKLRTLILSHKIISGIVLIAIVWGGYTWYNAANVAPTVTKYVVQDATTGTVISSVSATGQVTAASEVDVKPQASENVTKIYVTVGQHVTTGQLLVQLDTTNEAKALTQAQLSYQSSQLSLAKLNEAPATTTLESDQNSVTQSQQQLVTDSSTIEKDYQSGFGSISATFVDFQNVMAGLEDFNGGTEVDKTRDNPDAYVDLMPQFLQLATAPYATDVHSTYAAAVSAYQQNLLDYHAASINSSQATLDALFAETEQTAQAIGAAINAGKTLLDYVDDNYPTQVGAPALPTITTTYQTDFGNWTNTTGGDISTVTGIVNGITSDKNAFTNDTLSLQQKQETLQSLVAGADPLDVQSQQLSIQQSELSLQTAQENLADDSIRAPISGIVSAMPSVVGESVPSPAVSIVSDGELAQVTLNEIDAAKVNVGDKVTLTFDALPDVTLAGTVAELDPVGTVSQGVVNYTAQVSFAQAADTSSTNLVKPGMSVTADIVTQVDQNVIAVPNAAVHTAGGASYVLEPATPVSSSDITASASGGVLLPGGTKMVPVTTGLANETLTEIVSGVNVGDQIITQTITTSASTAKTTSGGTSALSALTGGARAGGAGFTAGGAGARTFTGGGAAGAGARVGG